MLTKTLHTKIFVLIALFLFTFSTNAQIRITEAMSSSSAGTDGTEDWVELTNLGTTDVDITGWKIDDSSYDYNVSVALLGVTVIPAGKSVIFIETKTPATAIPLFKTFWGNSLDGVEVGSYSGSGLGLSSGGDGVIIFNAAAQEVSRVAFTAATTGSSFYWTYDNAYNVVNDGIISTVGVIKGVKSDQKTITSDNVLGNIGSPGTAVVGGVITNTKNIKVDLDWRLVGKKIIFVEKPELDIEIFSLTGSKVATYSPSHQINLELNQGIYILKIGNKANKILVR